MDAISDWRSAFPLQTARAASDALLEAWYDLASPPCSWFNEKTREPVLTKKLKTYVQRHVARQRGLLGMWAAENVIGELDTTTGRFDERRTDIVYGWNDEARGFELVFEFKRLGRQKRHRDHYLGERGLARFVTGGYSRGQAIAAMVGVLLAPARDVIPPLQAALADQRTATSLRLRRSSTDRPYTEPSTFSPNAMFDTEHDRDQDVAPPHGYITVAHFFVGFGSEGPSGPAVGMLG
ncbi:MAG: Fis family transcriptional regulator [Gammaproteobacteria bacterium]|nr:Fis family transcriptional regulator [Gammaproteobacteria bacterium]